VEDHIITAGSITYSFDLDDQLSARTDGTEETLYTYSATGELQSVTLPDGTFLEYVHDPLGRRIAKKINGTIVEKYLWSGQTTLLAVYDGSDNLLQRFEYADDRVPYLMTAGGSEYYLLYDQVGSLRLITDSSGTAVKEIVYDSFGNILSDSNPSFTIPFGFAGGLHDRDTGLVRFGFRDYMPEIGRWTAKDPVLFAAGDTNLYGYALNDPINLIDPDGLKFWSSFGQGLIDGALGAAVVAGVAAGAIIAAPAAATAITGGLFVAGAIGGISTIASMVANPCPDNIGYNLGALTGGAIVGGLTGGFLNAKLSPPGQASPSGLKGWSLGRERKLNWNYDRSLSPKQNWNKAMSTGPTKLSAAGGVGAAGSGLATGGP
jgi:RHS repeat-associated protein